MNESSKNPCCYNCDYYQPYYGEDDGYGVCDIDLVESTPRWGWCPSYAERQVKDERQ